MLLSMVIIFASTLIKAHCSNGYHFICFADLSEKLQSAQVKCDDLEKFYETRIKNLQNEVFFQILSCLFKIYFLIIFCLFDLIFHGKFYLSLRLYILR